MTKHQISRRDFLKLATAMLTTITLSLPLTGCNQAPPRAKIILFDLSGSVEQCPETYESNKAMAQKIASEGRSGDIVVVIPFRSKGTPQDHILRYRTKKGPQDSFLKEDRAQAAELTAKIIEAEKSSITTDYSTDLLGSLAHAAMKAGELKKQYPGCKVALYVFSDGVHTRGRGLSGKFTAKTYNIYLKRVRQVVGEAQKLPVGLKFSRIEWFGRHDCGLDELDYQAVTFLQQQIELLWREYLADNVTAGNFIFRRSY
ncbi:MAG TPA: twin-arginine translocation signal domain-containing protein [Desulfobulbaceae bacterium]|nr:twin-arginine translocation signal domain-containing protein [Desulfobulbaceae bacterium]